MLVLPDYHLHTSATVDGKATLAEMAEAAVARGLTEIAITDHFILGHKNYMVSPQRLEKHFKDAARIGARLGIKILIGAEIDYFEEKAREIEKFIRSFDFDITLGAAHFVDGCGVASEESARELLDRCDPVSAFRKSLRMAELAVESGLFDVMAHLDIIRKYMNPETARAAFAECRDDARRLGRALARNGTGFEVNCRGFCHDAGSQYPSNEFLGILNGCGIETVTIGSDAHDMEFAGTNLGRGFGALRTAGFNRLALYEKRKAGLVSVEEFVSPDVQTG
jgi:histidinol-phosphatase (PHP family)